MCWFAVSICNILVLCRRVLCDLKDIFSIKVYWASEKKHAVFSNDKDL